MCVHLNKCWSLDPFKGGNWNRPDDWKSLRVRHCNWELCHYLITYLVLMYKADLELQHLLVNATCRATLLHNCKFAETIMIAIISRVIKLLFKQSSLSTLHLCIWQKVFVLLMTVSFTSKWRFRWTYNSVTMTELFTNAQEESREY